MPVRDRLRTIAAGALDAIEARLDAAPVEVERTDNGAAIVNTMTLAGLGNRDKGSSFGVNTGRVLLQDEELIKLYRISGITRRIVDVVPDWATRKPPTVTDREGRIVLARELEDLHALDAIRRAWTWARLIGGGYILLITDDGEALDQPLKRPATITGLVVLDGTEAQPIEYERRIERPRFRQPTLYSLSPSGPAGGAASGELVHWSRIVYIPGAEVPPSRRYQDKTHDDSVIEAMWQAVAGKEGLDSARDAMMQEAHLAVLTMQNLNAKSAGRQADAFMVRMAALTKGRSNLGTILLEPGEDYKAIDRSFTGWRELDESARTQLAAVADCPTVILWGTAPNGLSSDDQSARRQWAGTIAAKSERRLVPALRQIAEAMLPEGETVTVECARIDDPSESEAADTALKTAQADTLMLDRGILTPDEVRVGRYGDGNGTIVIQADEVDALPDDLERIDAQTYQPPPTARNAARKVIEWEREHGDEVPKGTAAGRARMRQLASGRPISLADVRDIASFNRHRANSTVAPEFEDTPWRDAGYVAWLRWGDTTTIDWARDISARQED